MEQNFMEEALKEAYSGIKKNTKIDFHIGLIVL